MRVKHVHIGVVGDRSAGTQLRIEFYISPGKAEEAGSDSLACKETGTFALVLPAQLRQGNWTQPVAVKLQQDLPSAQQSRNEISARFDREHQLYSKLCNCLSASTETMPVPQYFDIFSCGSTSLCPQLPPSILCRHAYHALRPRCPDCGGDLGDDAWASPQLSYVACKVCNRHYVPNQETKIQVVKATVRRDPACHDCPQSDAECRRSAMVLNLFPASLLILENIPLSLPAFLAEDEKTRQRARPQDLGEDNQQHSRSPSRLSTVLTLFQQLVDGVHSLHQRGIAHLAMTPRHVGVTPINGSVRVRVLDIAAALDRNLPGCHLSGTNAVAREQEYVAPEVFLPLSTEVAADLVPTSQPEGWEIHIPRLPSERDDLLDPFVLAGDDVEISLDAKRDYVYYAKVVAVCHESAFLRLRLSPFPGSLTAGPQRCIVRVVKCRGPAADMFSLGMILIRLLLPDLGLQAVRKRLSSWMGVLSGLTFSFTPSPRSLARALAAHQSQADEFLAGLVANLSTTYSYLSFIALDLFGMALRLLLRCNHPVIHAYVKDRTDDSLAGLARLRKELQEISRYAEASMAEREVERPLTIPPEKVRRVQELLRVAPQAESKVPSSTITLDLAPAELTYALYRMEEGAPVEDGARELSVLYRLKESQLAYLLGPGDRPVPKTPSPSLEDVGHYRNVVNELHLLASCYPCEPTILSQLEELHNAIRRNPQALMYNAKAWINRVGLVLEKSKAYRESLDVVRRYFLSIKQLFCDYLGSMTASLARPGIVVFRLGEGLWKKLDTDTANRQLERWGEYWAFSNDLLQILSERCQNAHLLWQQLPSPLRESLAPLAGRLASRRSALVEEQERHHATAQGFLSELRRAFYVTRIFITIPWEHQLKDRWRRGCEDGHLANISLHCSFLGELRGSAVEEALRGLEVTGLGPAVTCFAAVLVQEGETLLTRSKVHAK